MPCGLKGPPKDLWGAGSGEQFGDETRRGPENRTMTGGRRTTRGTESEGGEEKEPGKEPGGLQMTKRFS